MDHSGDKHWARSYLLDPLSEPQPSEETGPGTRFRPESASVKSFSPPLSAKRLSKTSRRPSSSSHSTSQSTAQNCVKSSRNSYPSPPPSTSPRPAHLRNQQETTTRRTRSRGSSLEERFPGDISHRPLEQIKRDAKSAHRAPRLRKSQAIHPDTVDSLSTVDSRPYHHEGPFDATLFARNVSVKSSPLDALNDSNIEALKATPREKIMDSMRGRRPLDGVAMYAPGEADRDGNIYEYEQGDNMMIAGGEPGGGAYKRWPGIIYDPDDIKGKGEPSFSIEKALKDRGGEKKGRSKASSGGKVELTVRPQHSRNTLGSTTGQYGQGNDQDPVVRSRTGIVKSGQVV